jgi:hypothetical protein
MNARKHSNHFSLLLSLVLAAFGCAADRPPQPTTPAKVAARSDPPSTPEIRWSRHTLEACAASIEFPWAPHASPDDDLGGGVIRKTLRVDWPDQPAALALSCAPVVRPDEAVKTGLDIVRDRSVGTDGRLVKETEVRGGREIVYDVRGVRLSQRMVVRDNQLIIALAVVTTVGEPTAERFLASLQR